MRTVGSLFAGIGGFDLGFERAGFKTVWQVEKNAYCRRVLRRHFPDADRRVTDVRYAGARNLLPVDVICGGFPCQDISNAGLRAGIDGARSGLWGHMHRIIGELRPRYVVVENVAALLGRGMGRVLGDLSEIGYDAEWQVISAAEGAAPHLRQRIWIVAYAAGRRAGEQEENLLASDPCPIPRWSGVPAHIGGCRKAVADSCRGRLSEPGSGQVEQPRGAEAIGRGEALADADGGNEHGRRGFMQVGRISLKEEIANYGDATRAQWSVEPNVGRVAHGVSARVDRLRALGNAVVPQIPELIARRLQEVMA